jgi:hypothetical protein
MKHNSKTSCKRKYFSALAFGIVVSNNFDEEEGRGIELVETSGSETRC